MTATELIDVTAANVEAREMLRRDITRRAMDLCGAKSAGAFLNAVEYWQDEIAQLERKGYCLACGGALVNETACVKCGRENR